MIGGSEKYNGAKRKQKLIGDERSNDLVLALLHLYRGPNVAIRIEKCHVNIFFATA